MSSFPERDISQNSVSTSYASISNTDDSLQHSCHSLCGQEGSWECQSDCSSYLSTLEILLLEEVSPIQSIVTLSQLQFLQIHNMLYEECNHPVTNPINGGLK